MRVGGQHYAPAALPPGKTRYPLYRRLGRPQGPSGRVRKILPPLGFDPRIVQPLASRYTDWAIPTAKGVERSGHISLQTVFRHGLTNLKMQLKETEESHLKRSDKYKVLQFHSCKFLPSASDNCSKEFAVREKLLQSSYLCFVDVQEIKDKMDRRHLWN